MEKEKLKRSIKKVSFEGSNGGDGNGVLTFLEINSIGLWWMIISYTKIIQWPIVDLHL